MATPATSSPAATSAAEPFAGGRLASWRYVLNTANLPEGMTRPDAVSLPWL
jgi:hypothetical protein